jgi:hypothetical protein
MKGNGMLKFFFGLLVSLWILIGRSESGNAQILWTLQTRSQRIVITSAVPSDVWGPTFNDWLKYVVVKYFFTPPRYTLESKVSIITVDTEGDLLAQAGVTAFVVVPEPDTLSKLLVAIRQFDGRGSETSCEWESHSKGAERESRLLQVSTAYRECASRLRFQGRIVPDIGDLALEERDTFSGRVTQAEIRDRWGMVVARLNSTYLDSSTAHDFQPRLFLEFFRPVVSLADSSAETSASKLWTAFEEYLRTSGASPMVVPWFPTSDYAHATSLGVSISGALPSRKIVLLSMAFVLLCISVMAFWKLTMISRRS